MSRAYRDGTQRASRWRAKTTGESFTRSLQAGGVRMGKSAARAFDARARLEAVVRSALAGLPVLGGDLPRYLAFAGSVRSIAGRLSGRAAWDEQQLLAHHYIDALGCPSDAVRAVWDAVAGNSGQYADVGIVSITGIPADIVVGDTITPVVTVRNYSGLSETVTVTFDDGTENKNYSATFVVGVGATVAHSFAGYVPFTGMIHTVIAVVHPSGADRDPTNNTAHADYAVHALSADYYPGAFLSPTGTPIVPGTEVLVNVQVVCRGWSHATGSITVTCAGGSYSSTKPIAAMTNNEIRSIPMDSWIAGPPGLSDDFIATVTFPGNTDPSDDQLHQAVTVES